jgi:hypothetical protein
MKTKTLKITVIASVTVPYATRITSAMEGKIGIRCNTAIQNGLDDNEQKFMWDGIPVVRIIEEHP